MLDDPLFMAERIAETRDRQDEAWRATNMATPTQQPLFPDDGPWLAQYHELKEREAWHEEYRHTAPFAACRSFWCRYTPEEDR